MFGRKKEKQSAQAKPEITAPILVIPDAFYGGADPVIHYASEAARNSMAPAALGEMRMSVRTPAKPKLALAVPKPSIAELPHVKHRKLLLIGGSAFFVLFVGLTAWYYFRQDKLAVRRPPAPKPVVRQIPPPVVSVVEPPPPVVSVVEPPPPRVALFADRLGTWPRIIQVDSLDIDVDALTDAEEEFFGTDSGIWDTDNDGYYDGQEVMNLYNPRGFAPIRLIDSGLVREYVNSAWQYRMYYPVGWVAAGVDPRNDQVIFSAPTGDFVEARVFQKQAGESFSEWFGRVVQGQSFTDLVQMSTRFKEDGWRRKDNLVAYYERSDAVYMLLYHPAEEDAIRFRQVMVMMRESFRPGETAVLLPDQTVLPREGGGGVE